MWRNGGDHERRRVQRIRKFLKALGVSAQPEVEKTVRHALAEGRLKGNEKLRANAAVTILRPITRVMLAFGGKRRTSAHACCKPFWEH